MSYKDHILLKNYYGGLWKTFTGQGSKEECQTHYDRYVGCYVCDLYMFLISSQ